MHWSLAVILGLFLIIVIVALGVTIGILLTEGRE